MSINHHQHVIFFPPPIPPLSPSYMWVVKHQEDSSRPFVLHIHLWINFHQSIQLTQGIYTNHLAHITWEDWPGVGGDEGRFAKWSLFEKKKQVQNMETEKVERFGSWMYKNHKRKWIHLASSKGLWDQTSKTGIHLGTLAFTPLTTEKFSGQLPPLLPHKIVI